MGKNITQLTLGRLLIVFLVLMFSIVTVIAFNFRSLVLASMEERVLSLAEITKAGLTAHMKAGLMKKRGYFLHEIASAPQVQSLSIIRSDAVNQQFGDGVSGEKRVTPFLRSILELKKPYYELNEWSSKVTMRAIVPYIATSQGNLNCLQCHHVSENTVLGAVDIKLDVTEYRNQAFIYLIILFGIISLFTLIIILNTSYVIEHVVRKPLLALIQLAKSVFYHADTKGHPPFESEEFIEVASQFMRFGEELKMRDKRIEQATDKLLSLNSEIDITLQETLFAMGEAEEIRSNETRHHTRRVIEYSHLLANLTDMDEHNKNLLVTAAPLHDIGKIGIPDSILFKVGPLNDEERILIKTHTTLGYDILRHSERDALQSAAIIAHEHHERWDGLGYPQGLRGENIHIFGRIVAIADVFDALGTRRVYKEAWSLEEIKEYFKEERGKSFDPHLVDLLLKHYSEFKTLHAVYNDEKYQNQ